MRTGCRKGTSVREGPFEQLRREESVESWNLVEMTGEVGRGQHFVERIDMRTNLWYRLLINMQFWDLSVFRSEVCLARCTWPPFLSGLRFYGL